VPSHAGDSDICTFGRANSYTFGSSKRAEGARLRTPTICGPGAPGIEGSPLMAAQVFTVNVNAVEFLWESTRALLWFSAMFAFPSITITKRSVSCT